MANIGGSSDPLRKIDNAVANVDDRTTSTANSLPEMENSTKDTRGLASLDEAPALEAPVDLAKLKRAYCVVVLTDSEGKPAAIGSLRAIESPACMFRLGIWTENRETSLFLGARFPRLPSDSNTTEEPFQRIWYYFYGDAFEAVESDITITKVTEYEELPDIITDRMSVLEAGATGLYKLQLTYKPEKVVTKAKDGPDAFSMPESSHAAQLFRSLVECETLTTLTLYFDHDYAPVDAVNQLKDRLKYEKDVKPSVEYHNKNGKIVIQYGKQVSA